MKEDNYQGLIKVLMHRWHKFFVIHQQRINSFKNWLQTDEK